MRTYNLFRRKVSPDLACAVPEDHPVPSFINAGWEFVGRVGAMSRTACRFNHDAAEASVQFNGFYLFQLIKPCREHVIPSPMIEQSELAQAGPPRGDKGASSSARRWLLDPARGPELIGA
jgi:hypothetical protein